MSKGKRMILEQGWEETKGVQFRGEIPFEANRRRQRRDPSTSHQLRYRKAAARDDRAQLFSLLARFQEINSPMVELVLETGCL